MPNFFSKNQLHIFILQGALGTELARRGYKMTLPLWTGDASLKVPNIIDEIYSDYITAGADIITTNTFRTNRRTFQKVGNGGEYARATRESVLCALRAKSRAKRQIYVGGVIAPLEDCYEPLLVPETRELEKEHSEQIRLMSSLGVDCLWIETMNTIREAKIAARFAQATNLPFVVSFVVNANGDILSRETFVEAVAALALYKPDAILVNCSQGAHISRAIQKLRAVFEGRIGAYAAGIGSPTKDGGWRFPSCEEEAVLKYLLEVKQWLPFSPTIIGGCCGTTPSMIRAIAGIVKKNS